MELRFNQGRMANRAACPTASDGQANVELALVAPVLFMLVLGVADLGRLFYTTSALENAAGEAAHTASTSNGSSQQHGNAPVLKAAYCELGSLTWNFTPPASPCTTTWTTDPYDYTYTPTPGSPTPNTAYIYLVEDTNFPSDVPGPPSPLWSATTPRSGGKVALVQVDYYWQPLTPFIRGFFPNGLVHVQVQDQLVEQY